MFELAIQQNTSERFGAGTTMGLLTNSRTRKGLVGYRRNRSRPTGMK